MRTRALLLCSFFVACSELPAVDGGIGGGAPTGGGAATGGGATGGGSTGGGGGDVDAGISIPLSDFCAQYAAAACRVRTACGTYASATSAKCLAEEGRSLSLFCARAMSGTLVYDGRAAADCLLETMQPPRVCYPEFPACGRLSRSGLATTSTPYVFTSRANGCASATCSATTSCDEDCTGPTCRAYVANGQPCSEQTRPFLRCDPSQAQCQPAGDGGTVCQPFTATGQVCTGSDCAPTDWCRFDSMANESRCTTRLDAGVACTPGDACKESFCTSSGVCGPLPAGATCRSQSECFVSGSATRVCLGLGRSSDGGLISGQCGVAKQSGEACLVLECDHTKALSCIDGFCRDLTPFAQPAGTECPLRPWGVVEAPFYGFATCARGLTCLPSTTANPPQSGRCAEPLDAGAPCRDVQFCRAGLLCADMFDGGSACIPQVSIGEVCGRTARCNADSTCRNQMDGGSPRCEPLITDGGMCFSTSECGVGQFCSAGLCTAPGSTTCTYDFECAGLACQAGQCVAMCIR